MPTHEENRKNINKRLYDINTTLDRDEAYKATVNYILKVSEMSYKQGIKDLQETHIYTQDWNDEDTEERLIQIGVKQPEHGTDTAT